MSFLSYSNHLATVSIESIDSERYIWIYINGLTSFFAADYFTNKDLGVLNSN